MLFGLLCTAMELFVFSECVTGCAPPDTAGAAGDEAGGHPQGCVYGHMQPAVRLPGTAACRVHQRAGGEAQCEADSTHTL